MAREASVNGTIPLSHADGSADDGKRLCEVRAVRNVVVRVAPQDILTSVLNRAREHVVKNCTGWKARGFIVGAPGSTFSRVLAFRTSQDGSMFDLVSGVSWRLIGTGSRWQPRRPSNRPQ